MNPKSANRALASALISLGIQQCFFVPHVIADEVTEIEQPGRPSSKDYKVTSKVKLAVSINRHDPEEINIGIFGNEAPQASKLFLSVCKGEYNGVSYDGSQVCPYK